MIHKENFIFASYDMKFDQYIAKTIIKIFDLK